MPQFPGFISPYSAERKKWRIMEISGLSEAEAFAAVVARLPVYKITMHTGPTTGKVWRAGRQHVGGEIVGRTYSKKTRSGRKSRKKGTYSTRVGGKYVKGKGGWKTVTRSAGENMIALRMNAKQGRAVAHLPQETLKRGGDIFNQAVRDFTSRAFSMGKVYAEDAFQVLDRNTVLLAEFMHKAVLARMDNAASWAAPVKEMTEAIKEWETKKKGLPPMTRTGQLRASFWMEVDVLSGPTFGSTFTSKRTRYAVGKGLA